MDRLAAIGVFVAVADAGSLSAAGRRLGMPLATVSRHLKALEDVACLVFLAHEFKDFAPGHAAEKVIEILRKTWRKMSERGRAAALALPLDPESQALVAAALAPKD